MQPMQPLLRLKAHNYYPTAGIPLSMGIRYNHAITPSFWHPQKKAEVNCTYRKWSPNYHLAKKYGSWRREWLTFPCDGIPPSLGHELQQTAAVIHSSTPILNYIRCALRLEIIDGFKGAATTNQIKSNQFNKLDRVTGGGNSTTDVPTQSGSITYEVEILKSSNNCLTVGEQNDETCWHCRPVVRYGCESTTSMSQC